MSVAAEAIGGRAGVGGEAARRGGGRMKKSLGAEIGQSFYLMGLMALMVTLYVGLGLLAVRVLG
jgi:hypothetical protein